ncbi:MAG TPA: RagB/SusD family nutrient uptake outer membrane protein [Chitinophaga sp.]|uniref:RagB/SusD family nutrient uptake outer membrane protein n=1 Tax=Chitinophaga sp. TaxID=1869181 RepID=UPI002DB81271|nr:RagB/SusD family nutrient uptake outer membrane protein [Chitinophaga sp.]HEU4553571.1 RagB/SusD family nutrient uptake outer membrane protein [Chitinophaga sp.]
MKLTRYITISIFSGAMLLTGAACNKKLDVLPGQSITPDQIKTADDVKAVLFGAYNSMQHYNAFGERYILMPDLLGSAGQVNFVGTFVDYRDVYNKAMVASSGIASGVWGRAYIIISGANTVISKASLLGDDERDAIVAEAKFIRGVAYYELVNIFGQPYSDGNADQNDAVPLVLDPVEVYDASKDIKPRAKVAEVYTQILADLTEAAEKMPASNPNGRANKYSALAFLSRVYLAQHKYTEAATAANDVIANGGFALTSSFDKAFNNTANSSEDIFAIQQNNQSNAGTSNNGLSTMYAGYDLSPSGRGDVRVDPAIYGLYDDNNDVRKSFVYENSSIAGGTGDYTSKWSQFYKVIPVVRLAEMYLTRAEANARSGAAQVGDATPLEDVNTVRARAGAAPLASVTADQVVQERFRELAFEGDWLWTKKRLKMNVGTKPYNDNFLIFPVPQRERDVNKQLTQNPGYGD